MKKTKPKKIEGIRELYLELRNPYTTIQRSQEVQEKIKNHPVTKAGLIPVL